MITKIVKENDALYDALFAEIAEKINEGKDETNKIVIQSLEDYFLHLEDIVSYIENEHMDCVYFLRLPIDEGLFEIDANKRTINIPANYKSNGIAVAGDSYAETLWFKIDRYYDLQDLSLTNIRIYWEVPGSTGKVSGWSTPVFKDIYSEARQLLFAWVIPDLLTEFAGDLKFSISFYCEGQDALTHSYEFNTLAQTVKINKTLERSDIMTPDTTDFLTLKDRLHNSTDPGKIYIDRPIFSDLTSPKTVTVLDKGNSELFVSAYTIQNGATMEYTLFRTGLRSNIVSTTVYIKTNDIKLNNNKKYYLSDGSLVDYPDEAELSNYCEQCQKYIISESGSYQCRVRAAYSGQYSASEYTTLWNWEAPTEFEVPNDAIAFTNNENGVISSTVTGTRSNEIEINWPSNSRDSEQQKEAKYEATLKIILNDSDMEKITTINSLEHSSYTITDSDILNTLDTELDTGIVEITDFKKTLNKTFIENEASVQLKIQSAAKPYPQESISLSPNTIIQVLTGIAEITLSKDSFNEKQTYSYVWERKSKQDDTVYTEVSTPGYQNIDFSGTDDIKITNISFAQTGFYRLKIKACFGKDEAYTVSSSSQDIVVAQV